MVGSLVLMAAAALSQPVMAPDHAKKVRPAATASARATARIQIISGVRFGESHLSSPAGATRRSAPLTDHYGQARPAELLEFQ